MSAHVSGLILTPVKGTRVQAVQQIELGPEGARGDRAFYVIDERQRMQNGKQLGELQAVVADYDIDAGRLSLAFPDGTRADGAVEYGDSIETRFFSRTVVGRPLHGPWSDALSAFVGRPLRIVAPEMSATDRGPQAAASIISRASLRRLAEEAETDEVDGRRFRMLIEVDGIGSHEEDSWMGRSVRIGGALVAVRGNVGRCLVTSRDPESGVVTLPTLDLLGHYRRDVEATEPLPFGIYAEVIEPGSVQVGDPVAVQG
jgi:uncharacterized protein YcbX